LEVVVMGDLVPFSGDWREQLAELNDRATRELGKYPEPDGCPAPGTWVRAVYFDDDMQQHAVGVWHLVTRWRPEWGHLQLRCSSRNRTVNNALKGLAYNLARSVEVPRADVCQVCRAGNERDGGRPPDPATITVLVAWRSAITAACEEATAALGELGVDPRVLAKELKAFKFERRGAQA